MIQASLNRTRWRTGRECNWRSTCMMCSCLLCDWLSLSVCLYVYSLLLLTNISFSWILFWQCYSWQYGGHLPFWLSALWSLLTLYLSNDFACWWRNKTTTTYVAVGVWVRLIMSDMAGAYFCMNMMLITLSSFLAVVVISAHIRGDRRNRVPSWLKAVTHFTSFLLSNQLLITPQWCAVNLPKKINVCTTYLFCSLDVLDPRVGHTMDVLSPFISVLCHSDWLFHSESCPRLDVVHPGRVWSSSPACTWHCSLHYLLLQATPLFLYDVTTVC